MRVAVPQYWTLRTRVGLRPHLFETLYRGLNRNTPRLTTKETDLVIEGYPRSGSSFAVFAFVEAQGRPMRVANHVHSASQLIRAAQLGLPACLLARDPADAVLALARKAPHLDPADLLHGYRIYYEALLPLRDHIVIATFEEVTSDFGRVIDRINLRFGASFRSLDADGHRRCSRSFLARSMVQGAFGKLPFSREGDGEARVGPEHVTRHRKELAACRRVWDRVRALAAES